MHEQISSHLQVLRELTQSRPLPLSLLATSGGLSVTAAAPSANASSPPSPPAEPAAVARRLEWFVATCGVLSLLHKALSRPVVLPHHARFPTLLAAQLAAIEAEGSTTPTRP